MTSSIRNFIIIFLVTLLLFGALGHYIVNDAIPALLEAPASTESDVGSSDVSDSSNNGTNDDPKNPDGETSESIESNSYTCVFLGTDINGVLCSVNLAHVDDGYKTYIFSSIPATVKVENKSGISLLSDIYKRQGAVYTVQKLEAMTGFNIDHYAIVSASKGGDGQTSVPPSAKDYDLLTLFNEVGGISCSIKEDIIYANPDYIPETPELPSESTDESSVESSREANVELSATETTEVPPQSAESSEEVLPEGMHITIPAGIYYINQDNYATFMDSSVNPYIGDIFKNLFNRVFTNASLAGNTDKQNAYLRRLEYDNFYDDKRPLAETLLFKYGSSDYKQIDIEYPIKGLGTADWEQAIRLYRNAVKAQNQ